MIGFSNDWIRVVSFYGRDKHGNKMWRCICKCGNSLKRATADINKGKLKGCWQCGVLRSGNATTHKSITRHGLAGKHPLHQAWSKIKQRCYNPKVKNYHRYGGRGIILCDEWKNDFKSFYDWSISNGWEKGLTVDRIDNNGNYEPKNCQFLTKSENAKKLHRDSPGITVGSNHGMAKIDEDKAHLIKTRIKSGDRVCIISKELNLSRAIVSNIACNKTWKHVIV